MTQNKRNDLYITKEYLESVFIYDNGKLIWKDSKRKRSATAGYINSRGYVVINIESVRYKAHRLIYIMHFGFAPEVIDHINGNRSDNRIENLRPATLSKNQFNSKIRTNNKTGCKNVRYDKSKKKYIVTFQINNKIKTYFRTTSLEDAIGFANDMRSKLHGEYTNTGKE